ncbi:hypothetical protein ILYODFUR_022522 [Ilyodon furcidens]|uniref:Uncharacterized protein n=1 Tax=Ilyodon furcidens TaxID=33524 RepID=A0ABV0U7K7_9TELE
MRQLVRGRLQGTEGEGLIDKMSRECRERDLEIMVLSDKNNLKRSHCLLLWGEGTFHMTPEHGGALRCLSVNLQWLFPDPGPSSSLFLGFETPPNLQVEFSGQSSSWQLPGSSFPACPPSVSSSAAPLPTLQHPISPLAVLELTTFKVFPVPVSIIHFQYNKLTKLFLPPECVSACGSKP